MARKKKKTRDDDFLDEEGDGEEMIAFNLSSDARRTIVAIFLLVLAALFLLGFFGVGGVLGDKLALLVGRVFGWGKFLSPFLLILIAAVLLRKKPTVFYVTKIIGLLVIFITILSLLHLLPFSQEEFQEVAHKGSGGGYIGYGFAQLLATMTGKIGGTLVLLAILFIGSIVAFNISLVGLTDRMSSVKRPEFNITMPKLARSKRTNDDSDEGDDDDEEEFFEEEDTEESEGGTDEQDDYVEEDEFDDADFDDDDFDDDDTVEEADEDDDEELPEDDVVQKQPVTAPQSAIRNTTGSSDEPSWELPPLRLFGRSSGSAKGGDVEQCAQTIQETLAHFGIDVELEDITTGPTVTQYAFRPPSGVKLSKITALNADLALALAAHPIRIEAPIPGKSLVGIEVPNKTTSMVRLREIFASEEFQKTGKKLTLGLGEDVGGEFIIPNLAKMPHLLVAGATGAGKSVTINSIILSLLFQNTPEDLRLILVDPKRVELSLYNGIPHLLSDVIVDNGKVLNALKWAVGEMDRRYKLLQATGSRDLGSYNQKRAAGETYSVMDEETGAYTDEEMENLPVIVVVIDELADLMASHGKEVEGAIVRLAQMSRAIGIHLIVSTQRPSVEVITGTIKANLPTRIALRVATQIDSRTIIDAPGAEKLIGNGDMLYVGANMASGKRLQGVFVDEDEVKKVVDFIKKQKRYHDEELGEDITAGSGGAGLDSNSSAGSGGEADDDLYEDAKNVVIEAGKASTSFLQRRLRVGYSRAARLVDLLEENGVIGPADGSKPRKVLIGADADTQAPEYDDPEADQEKREKW